MNFDLRRMQSLMDVLGRPQNKFPAIHIAGTNGKGSTAAFIASALRASGLKVGLYTSPHLVSLHERFQVNGHLIETADISRLARKVFKAWKMSDLSAFQKQNITQFEMLTAIAFLWFAEKRIDVGVIEVGLGGRLDATNVMHRVYASVITNIDLDHTHILGNTVPKIAREKAGIIKTFIPVITGARGEALSEIRKVANKLRAPLSVVKSPFSAREKKLISHIQLFGQHQRQNAAVALKTIDVFSSEQKKISDAIIARGFAQTKWPGRFEIAEFKSTKGMRRVIIDGAHNPAATKVLVQALRDQKIRKLAMIFGVLRDKNYDAMIRTLVPTVHKAIGVPLESSRSATKKELQGIVSRFKSGEVVESLQVAWNKALKENNPILVTGSLYLVGEFKRRMTWLH